MLIYQNKNNIITTSLGDLYKNGDVARLFRESTRFEGQNNRFYHITDSESVPRSLKNITVQSMRNEALKRFVDLTAQSFRDDYYDPKINVGYKLDLWQDEPTIYKYTELKPAITEFFKFWEQARYNPNLYDLSKLFYGMINFKDIYHLFQIEDKEQLKSSLYRYFPSFAIFFYEIYPFLKIEKTGSYDIGKLVTAAIENHELGLDTTQHEELISAIPAAKNNAMVLKLIRNKINSF